MNIKCFHIGLIWTCAIVSGGFAETFNSRPLQAELEATVTLGMESARGVRERCFATQTSTNQTYSVSPPVFAGTNGGWYLNNNLMSNLDLKATNLVPCYVDNNTVGTTNIAMLTVTGLWARLEIGDRTNQFTGMPAIGTNAATYGDYPWRIYWQALAERYEVLNALKITKPTITWATVLSQHGYYDGGGTKSAGEALAWLDRTNGTATVGGVNECFQAGIRNGSWDMDCNFSQVQLYTKGLNTNLVHETSLRLFITRYGPDYNDFGAGYTENALNMIEPPYIVPPEEWGPDWSPSGVLWGYTSDDSKSYWLEDWTFNYCTE